MGEYQRRSDIYFEYYLKTGDVRALDSALFWRAAAHWGKSVARFIYHS